MKQIWPIFVLFLFSQACRSSSQPGGDAEEYIPSEAEVGDNEYAEEENAAGEADEDQQSVDGGAYPEDDSFGFGETGTVTSDDGEGGIADDTVHTVWKPAPGTSWQWQLSGPIDNSLDVRMYDIDLFDVPQSVIDQLHRDGRVVVCYFSAGSYEEWRPDAGDFPEQVLGKELDGWPGERWLDIRSEAVRSIMKKRLELAVSKGCDGVEPDNVDGYQNDTGFPLTAADQLAYNRFLAAEAHARGLSVGLKNDLYQVNELLDDFDWALNEECFKYNECEALLPFIRAGKAVFQVEYGNASLAERICPQANALNFDTLIKKPELDAWRIACR